MESCRLADELTDKCSNMQKGGKKALASGYRELSYHLHPKGLVLLSHLFSPSLKEMRSQAFPPACPPSSSPGPEVVKTR
ncbi:unnamed protein product [Protopolystoma xenopodis]|uniref:Uncharacterized protein n=1 Tax=Protopolystoma xenopodis TaxID=117903 RepID=A0A3S5CKU7_9PLAT|nr:unnamed protein product [Protopolystoma xenopodis]